MRILTVFFSTLLLAAPAHATDDLWRVPGDASYELTWTYSETRLTRLKKRPKTRRGKKRPRNKPVTETFTLEAVLRPTGGKPFDNEGSFDVQVTRFTWSCSGGSQGRWSKLVYDHGKSPEVTMTNNIPKHVSWEPAEEMQAFLDVPKRRYRLLVSCTNAEFLIEIEGEWQLYARGVFDRIVLHPELPEVLEDGAKAEEVFERDWHVGSGTTLRYTLELGSTHGLHDLDGRCKTTHKRSIRQLKSKERAVFNRAFKFTGGRLVSASERCKASLRNPVETVTLTRKQTVTLR